MKLAAVDGLALILVLVGGLNWGLIGLFDFNLVSVVFAKVAVLEKVTYILVGISALYYMFVAVKK